MAASIGHTFSPYCMLSHASNEFTRRASVASTDSPPISVQYFYSSSLLIDDPLSPVPLPSSNPTDKNSKLPPRPFSVHDNIALEDGWLKYHKRVRSKNNAPGAKSNLFKASPKAQEHIIQVLRDSYEKQIREEQKGGRQSFEPLEPMPENRKDMIRKGIGNAEHPPGLGVERRHLDADLTLGDAPEYIPFDNTMPVNSEEIGNDELDSGLVKKKRSWSPFRRGERDEIPRERNDAVHAEPPSPGTQNAGDVKLSSSLSPRDTSGTPFLRIPARLRRSRSRQPSHSPDSLQSAPALGQADGPRSPGNYHPRTSSPLRPALQRSSSHHSSSGEEAGSTLGTGSRRHSMRHNLPKVEEDSVDVGMFRLHMVRMSTLKVSNKPSLRNPTRYLPSYCRCGPYIGIRFTTSRRLFVGPGFSGTR